MGIKVKIEIRYGFTRAISFARHYQQVLQFQTLFPWLICSFMTDNRKSNLKSLTYDINFEKHLEIIPRKIIEYNQLILLLSLNAIVILFMLYVEFFEVTKFWKWIFHKVARNFSIRYTLMHMEYTSWRRFACSLQKSIHDITMTQTTQSEMIASMSFDKPTRQPATSLCMCSNRFSPPRQNVWTYTVVTDRITMISISPVVASYTLSSLNSCLKKIVVIIEFISVMLSHGIAGDLKCYFLKVRLRLKITNINF